MSELWEIVVRLKGTKDWHRTGMIYPSKNIAVANAEWYGKDKRDIREYGVQKVR